MRTQKKPHADRQGAGTINTVCLKNTALKPACQARGNWFRYFFNPGEVCELRALSLVGKGPWEGWARGTVSGYFNDPDKLAAAAKSLDDLERATGIYFTLNPVKPALLARANNRLVVPKNTTADEQVSCHRWLFIDIDPKRPAGISASAAELKTAINCRDAIADYLHTNGWPEPIKAYSGNGGHLLYRLPDLQNTAEITELKKQALEALSQKFGEDVDFDTKVFNAARLDKLYGTWARKGDSTDDRPHRRSYLEIIPEPVIPVTLEQLQWLADQAPEEKPTHTRDQSPNGRKLDVRAYLNHYGVEIIRVKQEASRTIYGLRHCLFDPGHTPNEAAIIQMSDGKLLYQCFHKSCQHTWGEAREIISGTDSLTQFSNGYGIPGKGQTGKPAPLPIPDIEPTQTHDRTTGQDNKPLYSVIDIADFLATQLPPRENIVSPWLPKQGLAMIHSKRGIGKTFVSLNVAYAVACGASFLRWKVPKPEGVLFLDGEMPANVIQERLAQIVLKAELEPQKPLLIMSPDLQKQAMPDLSTQEGQKAVERYLSSDIELIIVDNISTLSRSGKENEAQSWLPLQEWALRLRAQGKTVLFIHHSGKTGLQRGTSKREDVLDTVISLRHTVDYEPMMGACFELHFEKSRGIYGADVEPFEARLEDGVWTMKDLKTSSLEKVIRLTKDGYSQKDIAEEIGKNKGYISRLVKQAKKSGALP